MTTSTSDSKQASFKSELVPEKSSSDPTEAAPALSKSFLQEASFLSRPSTAISSNQHRWSKLKDSLELQENLYSTRASGVSRYPPDSLPLNEAFEAGREANQNVSVNAQKVGSYLSRLQDYLEVMSHEKCIDEII